MTFYVTDCPLDRCVWHSEPLGNESQAIEALRHHVNTHTHGELVDHAIRESGMKRYQQQEGE